MTRPITGASYTARIASVVRRFWRMIVLLTVLGAGIGAWQVARTTPLYEANVNFLVSTRDSPTDLSGSSLADDRARIYAALAGADELARRVKQSATVPGSPDDIASALAGHTDLDSAVVHLTVRTPSSQRSLRIAQGVAATFPAFIASLDERGARTPTITLTETSSPAVGSVPVSPDKVHGIGFGLAGGLVLSLLLAWLRDRIDGSVRAGDELAGTLDAPLLGDVPLDARLSPGAETDVQSTDDALLGEAFRALRTNVGFLTSAGGARVLVVSSAERYAGCTSVVAGLATAAAEDGQRVAVLDANQLHAGVAERFGVTSPVGLIDVLHGRVALTEAMQEATSGPHVLPVGRGLRYALIDGHTAIGFGEVITELRGRFDLVLIDTPPVGLYAEAAAVAVAGADGVVLVARYGRSRVRGLRAARHALDIPQIPLLGAVMTCRPATRAQRYAYYGL